MAVDGSKMVLINFHLLLLFILLILRIFPHIFQNLFPLFTSSVPLNKCYACLFYDDRNKTIQTLCIIVMRDLLYNSIRVFSILSFFFLFIFEFIIFFSFHLIYEDRTNRPKAREKKKQKKETKTRARCRWHKQQAWENDKIFTTRNVWLDASFFKFVKIRMWMCLMNRNIDFWNLKISNSKKLGNNNIDNILTTYHEIHINVIILWIIWFAKWIWLL